jgi:hypothetical protein
VPARRLLLIAALLLGLSVVAMSVDPPLDAEPDRPSEPPAATAEPRASKAPLPAPPGTQVEVLSADDRGQRVVARRGRPLHLQITSSRPGSVQVGTDGPIVAVQPEIAARLDLIPERAGTQEVALLDPRRAIATIRTRR